MITKEIKEKWLEALKSGKYKQGKNEFYNSVKNEYCCLGVLCLVEKEPIRNGSDDNYDFVSSLIGDYTPLTGANDNSYNEGIRDYSAVIPLIQKLETE